MRNGETDSNWSCICCGEPIAMETGISLAGTTEFQLCPTCFGKLSPETKIAECRAWREMAAKVACFTAFERLCDAARGASAMSFLSRGGQTPN